MVGYHSVRRHQVFFSHSLLRKKRVRARRRGVRSFGTKCFSDMGKFAQVMAKQRAMSRNTACNLYADLYQMAQRFGGVDIRIKAHFYELPLVTEDSSGVGVEVRFY